MARKAVNPALLAGLVQQSQEQVVQRGTQRSTDPNFPVFSTPVNEKILVYIPKVNVVSDENGEHLEVLNSILHDTHVGKSFGTLRCINGLQGEAYSELGYDGNCPACEAIAEEWELYNHKMQAEAERHGIVLAEDTEDRMKPYRQKLLSEMSLKAPEEFVTFPIVQIPLDNNGAMPPDAVENLKPQFVHFRKKRYMDKIVGALKTLMSAPSHLGGQIMVWDFSYDTKGKQATPMDSAKNATYGVTIESSFLESPQVKEVIAKAEELASTFTVVKAAEVVTAVQFLYKEDIDAEVTKVMANDRKMLNLIKMQGANAALGTAEQPQNALASFGTAQADDNLGGQGDQPSQPASQAITFGQ